MARLQNNESSAWVMVVMRATEFGEITQNNGHYAVQSRECNPGTRVPENPGKPARFQTRKPGFVRGRKPGFDGFNFGCQDTQIAHYTARVLIFAVNSPDSGIL